jgi:hypothetical protein
MAGSLTLGPLSFGAVAALAAAPPALPLSPTGRWLVIAALALVAVYLLMAAVRCALRLVGLAVLALVAWLAWRWLA